MSGIKNGSKIVFSKKTDSKDSLSKESGVYIYEIATKKTQKDIKWER